MKQQYSVWAVLLCLFLSLGLLLFSLLLSDTKATVTEAPVSAESAPEDVAQEEPDPAQEEPEQAENEQIEAALLARATKIENVTVTHYCICQKCCGKTPDNPAYGITASGVRATPGVTVAVDPDVIPLGADVLVDYGDGEINYYRANDVGGAINGNHIDLCVGSHQEALQAGVKTATVWWVAHEN